MLYTVNHTCDLRGQLFRYRLIDLAKTQRLNGLLLSFRTINNAFDLGDFYTCHDYPLNTRCKLIPRC